MRILGWYNVEVFALLQWDRSLLYAGVLVLQATYEVLKRLFFLLQVVMSYQMMFYKERSDLECFVGQTVKVEFFGDVFEIFWFRCACINKLMEWLYPKKKFIKLFDGIFLPK